jgi:plastocyanin
LSSAPKPTKEDQLRLRIVLLAAIAALAVAGAASATGTATTAAKLKGTVGPGFTITLKDAKGKKVTRLKAGTYMITVRDLSSIHNFVLEGPGIDRSITSVGFTGTKTVTVKLRAGKKYKYYCRPHESSMFGFVAVS